MNDVKFTANQAKTMIRNSNHHFTLIQGTLETQNIKIKEMDELILQFKSVKSKADQTYMYVNKYQPLDIF